MKSIEKRGFSRYNRNGCARPEFSSLNIQQTAASKWLKCNKLPKKIDPFSYTHILFIFQVTESFICGKNKPRQPLNSFQKSFQWLAVFKHFLCYWDIPLIKHPPLWNQKNNAEKQPLMYGCKCWKSYSKSLYFLPPANDYPEKCLAVLFAIQNKSREPKKKWMKLNTN